MIAGMFDNGSLPALERLVQFTGRRQRVLADNIANIDTPYFKPADLDPGSFQAALGDAIDRRRRAGGGGGELRLNDTRQLEFRSDGITVKPGTTNDNILFHDQNNRDVERLMQHVAENAMAHRTAVELVRNQFDMIRVAIRERL
jgi:flagellar basal-body rod protein FlgB